MPRPQRDLELEAAVGIAQLIAEQILHLAQPVPDGRWSAWPPRTTAPPSKG
jgi:hypothetical protein